MSTKFENPSDALADWISKVNAFDLEGVLGLYSDDAVLLPTFSEEIRSSRDRIEDYFKGLSGYEKVVVTLHEDTLTSQPLPANVHVLGGTYRWNWIKDGVPEEVEARFSYVMDLGRESPIVHHHSSLVP